MPDPDMPPTRLGRPPKLDEHGTPTRERLMRAAIDACVEFGYEGVTLSDIARRADVSTPAVYGHFSGKAALLVEASRHELDNIANHRLPDEGGLIDLARHWLQPEFSSTRTLVAELHNASIRHPEVAELLGAWHSDNAARMQAQTTLTAAQVKASYLLLLGLTHLDAIGSVDVDQADIEAEVVRIVAAWLGAPSS